MPNHYTPLLYQFKYEIEVSWREIASFTLHPQNGYRADGATVVYDYKQAEFPKFSWKGYAGFSQVQDEVRLVWLGQLVTFLCVRSCKTFH
jgi:hypothetical protein